MQSRKGEPSIVIFAKAFPPHIIGFMVVQIAVINGVLMIGGTFLGMMLDRQFGTRPLFTIGLPVLGAVLSVVVAYRLGLRAVRKSREAYLDWAEPKEPAQDETVAQTQAQKPSGVAAATLNDAL